MKLCASHLFLRTCIAAAGALVLASCGGGAGDDGNGVSLPAPASTQAAQSELVDAYAATLSGTEETPSNGSTARGAATVVVDPATRQALVTLTVSGVNDIAVQIHQGAPGTTGPAVVTLTETADGGGVWTARIILTQDQFNALQAGNFYVEVASSAFPNGEIRGQIAPQQGAAGATASTTTPLGTIGTGNTILSAGPSTTTFISSLKGTQQVPPVASSGRAAGSATVNPATKQLVAAVTIFDVRATAVQIQEGAAGVNGPVVVPLTEVPPGSGNWIARATLTDAQYNALAAGSLYFNVLSAAFPAGELRGQLLPQIRFVADSVQPAGGTATTGIGTPLTVPTPGADTLMPPGGIDTGIPMPIPIAPAAITPVVPDTTGIGLTPGTGAGIDTGTGIGIDTGINTGIDTGTGFDIGATGTTVPLPDTSTSTMLPGA